MSINRAYNAIIKNVRLYTKLCFAFAIDVLSHSTNYHNILILCYKELKSLIRFWKLPITIGTLMSDRKVRGVSARIYPWPTVA
jgi:hypothetical protein